MSLCGHERLQALQLIHEASGSDNVGGANDDLTVGGSGGLVCRPHLRVGHPSHYEDDDSWSTSLDRSRSCCLCTDEMKKTSWLYTCSYRPTQCVPISTHIAYSTCKHGKNTAHMYTIHQWNYSRVNPTATVKEVTCYNSEHTFKHKLNRLRGQLNLLYIIDRVRLYIIDRVRHLPLLWRERLPPVSGQGSSSTFVAHWCREQLHWHPQQKCQTRSHHQSWPQR